MPETPDPSLRAWLGMRVDLEMKYPDGEVERLSVDIVADADSDFEHNLLGEGTPLAKAIYGLRAGEGASYRAGGAGAAGGEAIRVRVLAVSTSGEVDGSAAQERAERARKAIRDRDQMSAILFASSTDTKWGEYDPDGLKQEDDEEEEEKK